MKTFTIKRVKDMKKPFLIGLCALCALCGSMFLVAAQDEAPTPYTPPTLPPSPTPICANAQRNRLVVYERGRVTYEDPPEPLNIREGPNTNNAIIGEIPIGDVFFVLEGPRCSPNYAWYRVRYGEIEGWVAEGAARQYFTAPYPPG
jgi:hypothetical protein